MQQFSISFPFDEWYVSNAFENNKQILTIPKALGAIYIYNKSGGATVYALLLDSKTGAGVPSTAGPGRLYPIPAGTYLSAAWHGGMDFQNGIWVGAYSTEALAIAGGAPDGGNVLWIEANYRRGRIPNPK